MDIIKLQEPLPISEIDFRVQSINKAGCATILAYKNARVDINRLNSVCGVLGWKREHTRDNRNCIVSLWDAENKHWVSKEDTGTESNTAKEKGLASDSFKRTCFNIGIGIELYDYPVIQIWLNGDGSGKKGDEWELSNFKKDRNGKPAPVTTWAFKLKEWAWYSEFTDKKITFLAGQDHDKKTRFTWGKRK